MAAGSYTITEVDVSEGFFFHMVECKDPLGDPPVIDRANQTVTVVIDDGESIWCTFHNTDGQEGCSLGHWKNDLLDLDLWPASGIWPPELYYQPSNLLGTQMEGVPVGPIFNIPLDITFNGVWLGEYTLLQTLNFSGVGGSSDTVLANFMRQGVTALLNAAIEPPLVRYPYTEQQVIDLINDALKKGQGAWSNLAGEFGLNNAALSPFD